MADKLVNITETVLEPNAIIDLVRDDGAGAIDVFIGTVRNKTAERKVQYLDYEAYDPMAIKEIKKIIKQAQAQWPIIKVAAYHRKGKLIIGDVAVIVAVSTPHRQASFEACQFIIDTLKETVPIWKKEVFDGGEEWISAHP